MTSNWIARFQKVAVESINSHINSPKDLSSATVTGEIDREALPRVELMLNRFRNLALTVSTEPSAFKLTIPTPLNFMTPKLRLEVRL